MISEGGSGISLPPFNYQKYGMAAMVFSIAFFRAFINMSVKATIPTSGRLSDCSRLSISQAISMMLFMYIFMKTHHSISIFRSFAGIRHICS